ncbi:MAG: L,D-transpeptidase family protein [Verrucomicrobiales bacterium]
MRRALLICAAIVALALLLANPADAAPRRAAPKPGQMIVTVADSWNSSTGRLQCYERTSKGWRPAFARAIPVLLGRNGLAWGRGLHQPSKSGRQKREGDGRAPAGVFRVGKIYTYDSRLPDGANYPFRTVTKWDAWVDDPTLPEYNRHIVVDPRRVPKWFEKQKMRHGDFAYRWLIEVRHNSDPPKPGDGSAIFFHTRRGPDRKTAGCTTMSSGDLIEIMRWLDPKKHPQYTLLPKAEYERLKSRWGLPDAP